MRNSWELDPKFKKRDNAKCLNLGYFYERYMPDMRLCRAGVKKGRGIIDGPRVLNSFDLYGSVYSTYGFNIRIVSRRRTILLIPRVSKNISLELHIKPWMLFPYIDGVASPDVFLSVFMREYEEAYYISSLKYRRLNYTTLSASSLSKFSYEEVIRPALFTSHQCTRLKRGF